MERVHDDRNSKQWREYMVTETVNNGKGYTMTETLNNGENTW